MLSFVEITIGHSAIDNKDSYDKNYDKNRDGDDYKDVDMDGIAIILFALLGDKRGTLEPQLLRRRRPLHVLSLSSNVFTQIIHYFSTGCPEKKRI